MMRPYTELGCGSCGVAATRGLGAIALPFESGLDQMAVLVPIRGVELADTILSPGAVLDAMRRIDAAAQHLNQDILANLPRVVESAAGQRFDNDWIIWFAQWTGWYSQNRSGYALSTQASYVSGDLVAHIRQLAAEYNDFEARYRSITGLEPTYNPENPSPNSWLGLPVAAWVGIGAGVIGLGFVAWTASSVSKFAKPVRALRGRRR